MSILLKEQCTLSTLSLEKHFPVTDNEVISFSLLQKDMYYPYIEHSQIPRYVTGAINYGEKIANEHTPKALPTSELINEILNKKFSISFVQPDSTKDFFRAQLIRKPRAIRINKASLKEIHKFFQNIGKNVNEGEILGLHLYHEWFHYLEEKEYGRTSYQLPPIKIKENRLYKIKRRINKTREIAAHAFVKKILGLNWSPLVLDALIEYTKSGMSKPDIRTVFSQLKSEYEIMQNLAEEGMDST